MKNKIWNTFTYILKFFNSSLRAQFINFKYLAIDRAQYKSLKLGRPVDNKLEPIPWWTFPAIDFLNQFNFKNEVIFEYGPGNSTFWFIKKECKKIISIENEESWFQELKATKKNNQELLFRETKEEYFNTVLDFDFTVLIIDGKWRRENLKFICLNFEKIKNNLKMLIIDNPDKFQLGDLIDEITENFDFVQADFFGFGPAFRGVGCTTVLLHSREKISKSLNLSPYI